MLTHASPTQSPSSSSRGRQAALEARPSSPTEASLRASSAAIAAPPVFSLGGTHGPSAQIPIPQPVARLVSSAGPGEPLTGRTRSALESSLGVDLRAVRVHTDVRSTAVVDRMSARAFTFGAHIFLGSRERPTDLALMAHETTHAVQQQGGPTVQRKANTESGDALEREADHAAAAVQRGERVSVEGRTGGPRPLFLFEWVRRGVSAIGRGARAVAGAVTEFAGNIIERAVNYIREHARSIPGYDLLGFILGRDPLTQQPVERNAVNLIRGVLGLVPGGAAMFENLQRARVIERAFEWVTTELTRLNITWGVVRGAIDRFLSSLGASDILNLGGVFDRARAIFGPILSRIITFAAAAGRKILEFIFEGALALGGSAAQRVLSIFRRIGATFSLIVNDPVGFLSNLINAVKGGFQRFASNILDHLRTALFDWLFGALQGAGLTLPRQFNLEGILSIVLQILGLTYARMRERMVRLIGEPAVATLERVFEFVRILVTQGIAAAWQKILEFATGLVDTVIEGIRNWVITSIVRAAVTRLATMFNPVGAIINAIITIYNTVMFVVERARQIAAFVEAVIDSIDNIARGNISAAVNYVERTLARILSLVISFLARLIGLGGISDTIRNIIRRIQAVVDRAIDRVVNWIAERARGLASRALGGDPNAPPQARLNSALTEAVAAVNRLSGNTVGRAVISPLLAAIRTRHRLQSLEAIDRNGVWYVEGRVNPTDGRATGKRSSGGQDGSSRDRAIEIAWVKPPIAQYPAITIANPRTVAEANSRGQTVDLRRVARVTVRPTQTTDLVDGITIGVTNRTSSSLRLNYIFQAQAPVTGNSQKDRMNRVLGSYYGYDRSEGAGAPRDNDHVWEKQLGGSDAYENLWPLNESTNRSSGSTIRSEISRIRDELRISSLSGKWFKLKARS